MALILIVEDDRPNAQLIANMVQLQGHEAIIAPDGIKALELMRQAQPDLVILDLHLPGDVKGWDVTLAARQHPSLQHIPMVAMTAYDTQQIKEKMLAVGCNDYLSKPFTMRGLEASIRPLLEAKC